MSSAIELAIAGRKEDAEAMLAVAPAPESGGCWRAPMSIARTHSEVLLGGNDTSHLLQILCFSTPGSDHTESMDVMASMLSADGAEGEGDDKAGEVASALDARGRDVAKLVDLFWARFPSAALLLRSGDGGFEYAIGEGLDGPVDRAAAQRLAQSSGRILLPPPPAPPGPSSGTPRPLPAPPLT